MKSTVLATLLSLGMLLFFSPNSFHSNKINGFQVEGFMPMQNFSTNESQLVQLNVDLETALDSGVIIPTKKQHASGMFQFQFEFTNQTEVEQEFYYKIYYENTSYKHNEMKNVNGVSAYNEKSEENFYGSWEDTNIGFKSLGKVEVNGKILVKDAFRIVGNPRNEEKYFGKPKVFPTEKEIAQKIEEIKNNSSWYQNIVAKANQEKRNIDEQLRLDANYVLENDEKTVNQRWKRNPRMGEYQFILVVTTKQGLQSIPNYVQKIGLRNEKNKYYNPYYFYIVPSLMKNEQIKVVYSKQKLQLKTKYDLSKGVYVFENENPNKNLNKKFYHEKCGNTAELFHQANFKQLFHELPSNASLKNIPVIQDVADGTYSETDFLQNKNKFQASELVNKPIRVTDCPCETVLFDAAKNGMKLINKGNSDPANMNKESVGIEGRIGFTYGKFIAKIKFPELINDANIWNGITNAFWLIYQKGEWNNRDLCNKEGYILKEWEGANAKKRITTTDYSEIDIEIVKDSRYWPKTSYGNVSNYPKDDAAHSDEIMVTCTNWDMACQDASNFTVGAKTITIWGHTFEFHRWDHWYKALTLKTPKKDDELFKQDYFYYQIDWQPEKIIWSVGKSKENMQVVGMMDHTITKVPNNQMVPVITQEYHYGDWWPTTPFHQNHIPFPKNDIVGMVYDVEIE